MSALQKNQLPFEDEISLIDIIRFFKEHAKRLLFFILMGGILGGIWGKMSVPLYEGSILIDSAKVAGNFVIDPKLTLTKLQMNSAYSQETFLACNPKFYKDKDKDKETDYNMAEIVKTSITKDGVFLSIKMHDRDKSVIRNCLTRIESDISLSQKIIAEPLIEMKRNELLLAQNKLRLSEEFRSKLNEKQLQELKSSEFRFSTDILFASIILSNANEIRNLMDQLNKLQTDLSSEQTRDAGKVFPIAMEKRKFPSLTMGVTLGLCLGFILGAIVSLIKQRKIFNFS